LWLNGKQEGFGEESWPDGKIFRGYFKNGLKNGFGEYLWPDGSRLLGTFNDISHDSLFNAKGALIMSNGAIY
jgi:hypothetical protein